MDHDTLTPPGEAMTLAGVPNGRRCAIYARVSVSSSDTGLNSIDAQVQACEEFIRSQRSLGWHLAAPAFLDDGYSGGNLDRPALIELLKEVEAGRFDAVVVHRLDRLCRSVRDICDILPTFTLKQISLVSIAQAFDSESPMGRLTLHLLTSFGQFERELAGERTADKVAITRASGKWQRNGIPLGYVLNEKQALQVDPAEAAVVRDIFERVAEGGSVAALLEELKLRGYRTKLHVSANGNRHGGEPFNRNTLNQLLRNRMYVGEVFYKDAWHPASHEPIIDQALWDRVQAIRAQRTRSSGIRHEDRRLEDFPLNQRLFWHDGRAYKMHVSTTPKGRRHCYYVGPQTAEEKSSDTGPWSLATSEVHGIVVSHLRERFKNPQPWLDQLPPDWASRAEFEPAHVQQNLLALDKSWHLFVAPAVAGLIYQLVGKVVFYPNQMEIQINWPGLSELLRIEYKAEPATKKQKASPKVRTSGKGAPKAPNDFTK